MGIAHPCHASEWLSSDAGSIRLHRYRLSTSVAIFFRPSLLPVIQENVRVQAAQALPAGFLIIQGVLSSSYYSNILTFEFLYGIRDFCRSILLMESKNLLYYVFSVVRLLLYPLALIYGAI